MKCIYTEYTAQKLK